MRIYTKKGDFGATSLYGGIKILKSDPLISVLGGYDTLNALLGYLNYGKNKDLTKAVLHIQKDLMEIGAVLAGYPTKISYSVRIAWLEAKIDYFESTLPKLKNFLFPGGSDAAAKFHHARAVCRETERLLFSLDYSKYTHLQEKTIDNMGIYTNRLSDLLFVLARYANLDQGINDLIWNNSK